MKFSDVPTNKISSPEKAEGQFVRRSVANLEYAGLISDGSNLAVGIRQVNVQSESGINRQRLVQKDAGPGLTDVAKPPSGNHPLFSPSWCQYANWAVNFGVKSHSNAISHPDMMSAYAPKLE